MRSSIVHGFSGQEEELGLMKARFEEEYLYITVRDNGKGMSEERLLEAVSRFDVMPKVLVLSGYDDFKLVRDAFRLGACDYLLKADLNGELLRIQLQDNGGLEIFEVIIITDQVTQAGDVLILCSFLMLIFVLFLVMIGLMTEQSRPLSRRKHRSGK